MNFLFDHNQPPAWPRALQELSRSQLPSVGRVISLREKFSINTPDATWLNSLGEEGSWVVISGDFFQKRPEEREAVRKHGISVFVLGKTWNTHPFFPRTAQMIQWWPNIVEQSEKVKASAFEVPWRLTSKFTQIRI